MTGVGTAVAVDDGPGARLRRLRRDRHLSQHELGGDRFSASYVSHLETGRRPFSPEIVEYFAGRLGVPAEHIEQRVVAVTTTDSAAATVARQEVERAMAQHRFATAARTAAEAARVAEAAGAAVDAWSLRLLRARALFEDDEFDGAAAAAVACSEHPVAQGEPALAVEALLVAARAARAAGDVTTALRRTDLAVGRIGPSQGVDLLAETEAIRIGCLMELERTAEAVEVADHLAALVTHVESDHIRGVSQWIVGNVRLLTGATEEGIARHEEAGRLISPVVDLGTWGRFRRAAAAVRLQHGITEGVARLIDEARIALRVVGSASDLSWLRLAEARLSLIEGDAERARRLADFAWDEEETARSVHTRAELEALGADIALAAGDPDEAAAAYRRAALAYEEAQSLRRSVEMWRQHSELLATTR